MGEFLKSWPGIILGFLVLFGLLFWMVKRDNGRADDLKVRCDNGSESACIEYSRLRGGRR